jgi:hypothetical protein
LVWQQTHRLASTQGFDQLTHTVHAGRDGFEKRFVSRMHQQFAQPCLSGRTVQHRHRAVCFAKTQGTGGCGDFKAAQMGRDKHHAFACGIGIDDVLFALPLHGHGRAKPNAKRFQRLTTGRANGPSDLGQGIARMV